MLQLIPLCEDATFVPKVGTADKHEKMPEVTHQGTGIIEEEQALVPNEVVTLLLRPLCQTLDASVRCVKQVLWQVSKSSR